MKLPLVVSVPHGGLEIPPEVRDLCLLTPDQVRRDGDEGAAEIYRLQDMVEHHVAAAVARAVVDVNRAPDDRRDDGVVKSVTIFGERVHRRPLPETVIRRLLARYHAPYHAALSAAPAQASLGVDGHTMLAAGPPVGPDPGRARPLVCLGNADGTCPAAWMKALEARFRTAFGDDVAVNRPFRGGYIIRTHARERPWVQVELSRTPTVSLEAKRAGVREALESWCRDVLGHRAS